MSSLSSSWEPSSQCRHHPYLESHHHNVIYILILRTIFTISSTSSPWEPSLQCRPPLGFVPRYGGRNRCRDTESDPNPEKKRKNMFMADSNLALFRLWRLDFFNSISIDISVFRFFAITQISLLTGILLVFVFIFRKFAWLLPDYSYSILFRKWPFAGHSQAILLAKQECLEH